MKTEALRATLHVTKALADAQRVRVLMMLKDGELCVCQIVEVLQLAMSTVSKHLSILEKAGLVNARKEGRWMYYRRPSKKHHAQPVLSWLDASLCDDTDIRADRKILHKVTACTPAALRKKQQQD